MNTRLPIFLFVLLLVSLGYSITISFTAPTNGSTVNYFPIPFSCNSADEANACKIQIGATNYTGVIPDQHNCYYNMTTPVEAYNSNTSLICWMNISGVWESNTAAYIHRSCSTGTISLLDNVYANLTGSCFSSSSNAQYLNCYGYGIYGNGTGSAAEYYFDNTNSGVKNCIINSFSIGIIASVSNGGSYVYNNSILNSTSYGIQLIHASTSSSNVFFTVRNNSITSGSGIAVGLTSGHNFYVYNNTLNSTHATTGVYINFDATDTDSKIENNTIIGTATYSVDAKATTSENLTLKLNANDGAAYDTTLVSMNPSLTAAADVVYIPDGGGLICETGDAIDVAFTNTDARTYGLRIVYEVLG